MHAGDFHRSYYNNFNFIVFFLHTTSVTESFYNVTFLEYVNFGNYYFLILRQTKITFFIYLSIKNEGGRYKYSFAVVESRSILYSSKTFDLQVGWFSGYSGVVIEQ